MTISSNKFKPQTTSKPVQEDTPYPLLQIDPVLEMGLKEMLREVIGKKSVHCKPERVQPFTDALYNVVRRTAMADDLTQEQHNKMTASFMDELGTVYFDGMDFDKLELSTVHNFHDDLVTVVAECLEVSEKFLADNHLLEGN